MGLRTPQEYLNGLRDGRVVYFRGERVEDITTHPVLGRGARHTSTDFHLAEDPTRRDLMLAKDPDSGGDISRYFLIPRTPDDLLRRRDLIETVTREAMTIEPLVKVIGTDAIFTMMIVCPEVGDAGPKYAERVRRFYEHCRDHDLTMAVAQTDMKGDRGLRPHEQPSPETYVRVVEERPEGIIVRGAKAHTTNAVYADEIIVIPTRALGPDDRAYAVAFALPANTPGIRFLASPRGFSASSAFDNPVSSRAKAVESITIFDDVLVPWDRVFLNGEWQAAGALAKTFVEFHRFTAVAYKPPLIELMVGAAALMAEYNGIERATATRDKLAALVLYLETVRGLTKGAAAACRLRAGIAVPDVLYTNAAKYYFAINYHNTVRLVQDIAGGLVVTGPAEEDWENIEIRRDLERLLVGGGGSRHRAEDRLRAINLIRDVTASDLGGYLEVLAIHAEGSLEAQKMAVLADADVASYKAYASRIAGIALGKA